MFLGTTVETENETLTMDKSAAETASLLEFLDKLFDSLNGSSFNPSPGKNLRSGVTKSSPHKQFWLDALGILRTFRYRRNNMDFVPPSLRNLIRTLKNFQKVFQVLTDTGFSHIMPRTFNQDPLENFFGKMRQRGHRNINPTATEFIAFYKSLLVNGLTSKHSVGGNC
ncbi:MAG: hypothetical protein KTM48_01440, partial [Wolbachia endosymbiont of Pissodes strobi]|nr:hypothetical protein [Wolbachia endosymbiont of Pissodes strobi]